jgi:hypothetical protein
MANHFQFPTVSKIQKRLTGLEFIGFLHSHFVFVRASYPGFDRVYQMVSDLLTGQSELLGPLLCLSGNLGSGLVSMIYPNDTEISIIKSSFLIFRREATTGTDGLTLIPGIE